MRVVHTNANVCIGHGSFGVIRKVKRKSDGYVGRLQLCALCLLIVP